jgi:hypothetical protein
MTKLLTSFEERMARQFIGFAEKRTIITWYVNHVAQRWKLKVLL